GRDAARRLSRKAPYRGYPARMDHAPDLASPAAWWRWARQWRKTRLVDGVDRIAVLEHVHEGGELGPRYAFMVVMSCGIAALGLLQDSAAVIIGAMLISPLMGPIINLGMGLATFDLRTVRESLRTLGAGVALALAIAIPLVWLSPLQEATGEILARTRPTFFDLLVAVLSGLAGAYATITRKGETIVGVAIATALMPPLAVVGFGTAVGNWDIARGAAFLFMTNLLAIALSVTIVARWYGFGGDDTPKQSAWQALLIVGTFVLLSIPLGLALKRIALQSQTELTVRTTLDAAAAGVNGRVSALRVDTTGDGVGVDAVVLVPTHAAGLEARLQRTLGERLGRPVAVRVREVLTADDATVARQQGTLAELKRSVLALQDAESVRAQKQQAAQAQQARVTAALLPYLGRLQRATSGPGWELWLAADARVPLARAQRIEREIDAARQEGDDPLRVVPALQGLPPIALGPATDDAIGPDPRQQAALEAQAWALQRWRATRVDVVLAGVDDARADAWEQALRSVLSARGIAIGEVERRRGGEATLQLALPAS
ncbi:MAG TPA: DUF389 domain-containing protein, partial [Thermomonas sp.]|nr:DUF389 domain-containing protein [Thermomonas sp.]